MALNTFSFWEGDCLWCWEVFHFFPTDPSSPPGHPLICLEGWKDSSKSQNTSKPAYLFSRVLNKSTQVLSFKQAAFVYTKCTLLYSSIWFLLNNLFLLTYPTPLLYAICLATRGKKRREEKLKYLVCCHLSPFRLLHTNLTQTTCNVDPKTAQQTPSKLHAPLFLSLPAPPPPQSPNGFMKEQWISIVEKEMLSSLPTWDLIQILGPHSLTC